MPPVVEGSASVPFLDLGALFPPKRQQWNAPAGEYFVAERALMVREVAPVEHHIELTTDAGAGREEALADAVRKIAQAEAKIEDGSDL